MPEISQLLPLLAMIVAVGALVGILAGLFGIGGGVLLVLAFFYAFTELGYAGPHLMQICLATSLATIMMTSARSVMAHHARGAVDWALLRRWAPGIALGAVLGVVAATGLRSAQLQAIFGVLASLVALYMGFGNPEWRLRDGLPKTPVQAAISAVVGFLSVLMGIGGASFGVPILTAYGMAIHRAVATAAGFGMLIAVPSVLGFLLFQTDPATRPPYTIGAVNLPAAALVVAVTYLTTPLGVRMAHAMNPGPLRRVFALMLVFVAVNMLRKAAGW